MSEEPELEVTGNRVRCGDGTGGRIAAPPGQVGLRAAEMCRVHGGVDGPPEPEVAERAPAAPAAGPPPAVDTADWMSRRLDNTCTVKEES